MTIKRNDNKQESFKDSDETILEPKAMLQILWFPNKKGINSSLMLDFLLITIIL